MNISEVQNMTRVGEIVRHKNNNQRLSWIFDPEITREMKKDQRGRVYCLCVDGEIHKIGGSQAKDGIIGTYGAYFSGFAMDKKGGMRYSARTYCVWKHIDNSLKENKKVEVYCLWAPLVNVTIPTMQGKENRSMPVDFHTIEESFVKSYVEKEGKYPYLNIQESGRRWIDTGLLEGYTGLWAPENRG
jgi:hypothetical protein